MNEEIMNCFEKLCNDIMPHIEAITEALKTAGIGEGAISNLVVSADGYIRFDTNLKGCSLIRLGNGDRAKIEFRVEKDVKTEGKAYA